MDKKEDKGDGIIHKFTKELENIPESTTYIEVAQDTKSKFARIYLLILCVFLSVIITLISPYNILSDLNQTVIFMVLSLGIALLLIAAIASALAYFIYLQLSTLNIKVTQKEDNLFYKIKKSLKHTAFILSLSLVSFYSSELILTSMVMEFLTIRHMYLVNIICLSLFTYFFLLSFNLIVNLIHDMIKHAHSVVIQSATGKRSE